MKISSVTAKPLKVLVTNAYGLCSKFGEFQHAVISSKADIAIVTETKLTPTKVSSSELTIPGYAEPFRLDRTANGGGVGVWVRSTLCVASIDTLHPGNFEVLWLSIQDDSGADIVLAAVYRPGSCSESDLGLLEYLDNSLDKARKAGSTIILAGDFNVHNQDWLGSSRTTRAGEFLEDVCAAHGLTQHVQQPTRGDNVLDLVMSDFPGTVAVKVQAPLGRSDHNVVLAEFQNMNPRFEPKASRTVWRYNHADWPRLRAFYRKADWSSMLTSDANESCENVTRVIKDGMTQFIPSKTLCTRPSDPSWWTPECSSAVSAKQKAWKAWRRARSDASRKGHFVDTVQHCVTTLHAAKLAKEHKLRTKLAAGNMKDKEWWSCLKQAGGNGRHSDIPLLVDNTGAQQATNLEKATCFGSFFSQKCSLGDDDIHPDDVPDLPDWTGPCLSDVHFRVSHVTRLLSKLDTSKATGPDGIPARVLKECAKDLGRPITSLYTLCFRSGVQPSMWKTANVVPVHKRDSKSVMKNYRPVSLLSILSKVMESIVNQRLTSFLEKHGLLSKHQFGFRGGMGTADLLTALHTEWIGTLAAGGAVQAIAIDIAGAFDRVSHTGVLAKAAASGVRGQLLEWLKDYLSERHLQVVVGGSSSSAFPVAAGVPQGSILGPSLFLLYVNDAETCLADNVSLAVYADDTTLYVAVSSPGQLNQKISALQSTLSALEQWGKMWRIQFEPSKSQAMFLDHHRNPWLPDHIDFGGHPVQHTNKLKLLGVTFDNKLLYRDHLRLLATRGNQRLSFLRRTARFLTSEARLVVYKGFVRPVLEYACLVWMGAAPVHLSRLDSVQRRALKVVGSQVVTESLEFRRTISALCYLFKLQCLSGPPQLLRMVPPRAHFHPSECPRTRLQLAVCDRHAVQLRNVLPACTPNSVLRSFPHNVIDLWNELPPAIMPNPLVMKNLQSFKSATARYLKKSRWLWATDYAN